MSSGTLFVLSAASGCGKTTVLDEILKRDDAPSRCITYTTRPMREGEVDGEHYHFISKEDFEVKQGENFFLEWANVYGNLYGTSRKDVEDVLESGCDVIVSVDVQGARTIRSKRDAVLIFLIPPSKEELIERLKGRGTETPETFKRRIEEAENEMAQAGFFDFQVTNDTIEHCVENLLNLIEIERNKRR